MEAVLSVLKTVGLIVLVVMFFNVMIFVHELGHFLAGKWRGAYIDRFQIWFGKPIWKKKIGEVTYGIGWIPAGGFVSLPQMEDMEMVEGEAIRPDEEQKKKLKPIKPLDKVIIAAAGPLFSLLLAYFFAVFVWILGKPDAEVLGTTIGYIAPKSPAAEAGLLPGDKITAIDGKPVTKWMGNMEGVRELIALSENEKIRFSIERSTQDGTVEKKDIDCGYKLPKTSWWERTGLRQVGIIPSSPVQVETVIPDSPAALAGLTPGDTITAADGKKIYTPAALKCKEGVTLHLSVRGKDGAMRETDLTPALPENWKGLEGTYAIFGVSWKSRFKTTMEHPTPQKQVSESLALMWKTLQKIAAPKSNIGMEHLSGPVGIGTYLYDMMTAPSGILLALWFAVVLNVNLAVLNILPLPIVDGGHVVLGTLEMILKRPVQGRFLTVLQYAFFFVLIGFFLFVTFKDVGSAVGGKKSRESLPYPVFSTPAP